jgi:hypothetical protein
MTDTVKVCGNEYVAVTADDMTNATTQHKNAVSQAANMAGNADNAFGKLALVAALAGTVSVDALIRSAYSVYSPRDAKGKARPVKADEYGNVSTSALRYAVNKDGRVIGDSIRKALDAIRLIVAKVQTGTDASGANVMEPAIAAFINGTKGAAKSVRTLADIVEKAAQVEHERTTPPNPSQDDDNAPSGDDKGDDKAETVSLADMVLTLSIRLEQASDEDAASASEAIALLMEVIGDRYNVAPADADDMAQAA